MSYQVLRLIPVLDRYGFFNHRISSAWDKKAPYFTPRLTVQDKWDSNLKFDFSYKNWTYLPVKYTKSSLEDITDEMCAILDNLDPETIYESLSPNSYISSALIRNPWEYLDTEGIDLKLVIECAKIYYESYQKLCVRMYHYLNGRKKIKEINDKDGQIPKQYQNLLESTMASLQFCISRLKDLDAQG